MSKIVEELEATLRGGQTPNEALTRRVIREMNRKQAEIANAHKDKMHWIGVHSDQARAQYQDALGIVIATINYLTDDEGAALANTVREIADLADNAPFYGRTMFAYMRPIHIRICKLALRRAGAGYQKETTA